MFTSSSLRVASRARAAVLRLCWPSSTLIASSHRTGKALTPQRGLCPNTRVLASQQQATLATGAADASAQARVLNASTAPAVLDTIDTLILDCDGVLWRGSEVLQRTSEALQKLRARGKRLLFVTNNSSKSRAAYVSKFSSLGLQVDAQEIVSSSYAAAAYLQSIGFDKTVFLIGPKGVEDELQAAGIPFVGGEKFTVQAFPDTDSMVNFKVDPSIGAVVVGWDPYFSYSKMVYSSICLRELPGCLLVATNLDHADHISNGRMMPGTGGIVSAVEIAADHTAVNVGKGGAWLLPFLCRRFELDPARTAIVGDRLDTDIHLGKQGGLTTILPLTGVTTLAHLDALSCPEERPDHVITTFADLAGLETSR